MVSNNRIRFGLLGLSLLFLGGVLARVPAEAAKRKKVVYNRDVRPILSKCLTCHGNDKNTVFAGLRLDNRKGATALLASGRRAIVPGSPAKSELLKRIHAPKNSPLLMPPASSNKVISAEEKRILAQWIEEGAEFSPHWAFVKAVRPALPVVKNSAWPKNEIDRFILAELEDRNLKPSPQADKATLIRRVTLDLTGLPPTPFETDDFLADTAPGAYERVVDRLLASPRYAERMAMDWMDYARYADSNGYQADYERYQWRWRDWVLNAFDKNMPYDRFTVEQLAGDLLPNATLDQKIATGFNRNHRINTEGGVVPEEWRVENVIDRVETTSTVWLGLTSGCARCHDHKYDPISQKEFYGIFAYFNNIPETGSGEERPVNHPPFISAPLPAQVAELKRRRKVWDELEAEVANRAKANEAVAATWVLPDAGAQPSLREGLAARYSLGSNPRAIDGIAPEASQKGAPKFDTGRGGGAVQTSGNDYLELGNVGDFDRTSPYSFALWIRPQSVNGAPVAKMNSGKNYQGWDLHLANGMVAMHLISSWPDSAIKVNAKPRIKENEWTHVAVSYDGSGKAAGVRIYLNGAPVETEIEADRLNGTTRTEVPLTVGRRSGSDGYLGAVEDLAIYQRVISPREVAGLSGSHPARALLDIPAEKRTADQRLQLAKLYSRENDPEFAKLDQAREAAAKSHGDLTNAIPTVMVMEEMRKPRPAYLLKRGLYDHRGEIVPPTIPKVLPAFAKGTPNNRLGLAKWIVDPANPLTARVTVNRFWERFFGNGIVSTIEDFGTRAEFPTHPQLLDWMATDFVASGWNVKGFLRKIVTSATYRQSSAISPELLKMDPVNRYLARGPRFRLPAEVLRDQALMTAGLLKQRLGGPSVRPYQPEGIWDELNVYGNLRNYKPDVGEGRYRRSLYTIWKRTAAPPNMTLFDSSTRETCRVQRARTNTPLQALVLLNDVTFFEAARGLAQRTLVLAKTPESRIQFMARNVLGRRATAAELQILRTGLARHRVKYSRDLPSAEKLVKVGDLPRPAGMAADELAAYTLLASTILNLDEAATKE